MQVSSRINSELEANFIKIGASSVTLDPYYGPWYRVPSASNFLDKTLSFPSTMTAPSLVPSPTYIMPVLTGN